MNRDTKISSIQLFMLMTGYIIGTTPLVTVSVMAERDAWLAYIFAWIGGLLLIVMYTYISILNRSQTLIEIFVTRFGNLLGSVVGLFFIWYFLHNGSLIVRDTANFISTVMYVQTPMIFSISCIMIVVVYMVKNGLEVMARASELLVMILPVLLFVVSIGVVGLLKFSHATPFLEKGLMPVLRAGFAQLTFPFGQTACFLIIFPYLNKNKNLKNITIGSTLFAGSLILLTVVGNLLVLGVDIQTRHIYPAHSVARIIPNIDVDPFVLVALLVGTLIKISVTLYAVVVSLTQLFHLDDYKPFVLPLAILFVLIGTWDFESTIEFNHWIVDILPIYFTIFQVLIPVIVLLVSIIWKEKVRKV